MQAGEIDAKYNISGKVSAGAKDRHHWHVLSLIQRPAMASTCVCHKPPALGLRCSA